MSHRTEGSARLAGYFSFLNSIIETSQQFWQLWCSSLSPKTQFNTGRQTQADKHRQTHTGRRPFRYTPTKHDLGFYHRWDDKRRGSGLSPLFAENDHRRLLWWLYFRFHRPQQVEACGHGVWRRGEGKITVPEHNTTQHNTTQHDTTRHSTTQHNTTQHSTTQHNTQHNTAQHNTTQHDKTQRDTSQCCTSNTAPQ